MESAEKPMSICYTKKKKGEKQVNRLRTFIFTAIGLIVAMVAMWWVSTESETKLYYPSIKAKATTYLQLEERSDVVLMGYALEEWDKRPSHFSETKNKYKPNFYTETTITVVRVLRNNQHKRDNPIRPGDTLTIRAPYAIKNGVLHSVEGFHPIQKDRPNILFLNETENGFAYTDDYYSAFDVETLSLNERTLSMQRYILNRYHKQIEEELGTIFTKQ